MSSETLERSPAEIEARIEQKRASLDRKLSELEHKLSPREQLNRVKQRVTRVDSDSVIGWAAVGAVAAGTVLAINGWRRAHANGYAAEDELADVEQIVMLDCADLPPVL
jgi:vacuolar-type H+-ATPase subunit I/STV1